MSDIEITQKSDWGSKNIQIGNQNNFYGLTPADAVDMAYKMFREFYPVLKEEVVSELYNEIIEKLSEIPRENIVPASSRIAIPTLLNAVITGDEDKEIRRLYANLLASSMNKIVKNDVHPGYVEIIKQLCPDEAKILKYIAEKNTIPTISLYYGNSLSGTKRVIKDFSNVGFLTHGEKPFDVSKYLDNFVRLGLVEIPDSSPSIRHSLIDDQLYVPLREHPYIQSLIKEIDKPEDKDKEPKLVEGYASLTDYGRGFCAICLESKTSADTIDRGTTIERSEYLTSSNIATDEEFTEALDEIWNK